MHTHTHIFTFTPMQVAELVDGYLYPSLLVSKSSSGSRYDSAPAEESTSESPTGRLPRLRATKQTLPEVVVRRRADNFFIGLRTLVDVFFILSVVGRRLESFQLRLL